jgi:hypothetical protein
MEDSQESIEAVKRHLKTLLLHLAAKSDTPGADLEEIVREVVDELRDEVKRSLAARKGLKLVMVPEVIDENGVQ